MGPFDSLTFEKYETAGHLVNLKPYQPSPAAGHVDTAINFTLLYLTKAETHMRKPGYVTCHVQNSRESVAQILARILALFLVYLSLFLLFVLPVITIF